MLYVTDGVGSNEKTYAAGHSLTALDQGIDAATKDGCRVVIIQADGHELVLISDAIKKAIKDNAPGAPYAGSIHGINEEFVIKAVGEDCTYTREHLADAIAVADSLRDKYDTAAVVILTSTGWIEYVSTPVIKYQSRP